MSKANTEFLTLFDPRSLIDQYERFLLPPIWDLMLTIRWISACDKVFSARLSLNASIKGLFLIHRIAGVRVCVRSSVCVGGGIRCVGKT